LHLRPAAERGGGAARKAFGGNPAAFLENWRARKTAERVSTYYGNNAEGGWVEYQALPEESSSKKFVKSAPSPRTRHDELGVGAQFALQLAGKGTKQGLSVWGASFSKSRDLVTHNVAQFKGGCCWFLLLALFGGVLGKSKTCKRKRQESSTLTRRRRKRCREEKRERNSAPKRVAQGFSEAGGGGGGGVVCGWVGCGAERGSDQYNRSYLKER